jgi:tetratricopeptide repeat protein
MAGVYDSRGVQVGDNNVQINLFTGKQPGGPVVAGNIPRAPALKAAFDAGTAELVPVDIVLANAGIAPMPIAVLVRGESHPDTLTSRNNLAEAYREVGRPGEAVTLHERTLADRVRVQGASHPDTLSSANNLAYAYAEAGRVRDAIPLFEFSLAGFERVLGTEHPITVGVRRNLARARRSVEGSGNTPAGTAVDLGVPPSARGPACARSALNVPTERCSGHATGRPVYPT